MDTCSDVSVARREVLVGIHYVQHPVLVEHMGGETLLREAGALELRSFSGAASTFLYDVRVVEPSMLPAGIVALFGVADIQSLNLSLDAIMANADRSWESSVRRSWFGRMADAARRCIRRVYSPVIVQNAVEVPQNVPREPQPVPMPAQIQEQPALPTATEVGHALLAETRLRVMAEQEHRAAMRIAELMHSSRER